MQPGEARKGDVVYTPHKYGGSEQYRIVRGEVSNITYPGTTNEIFQVLYQHLDGSQLLDRKPAQCENSMNRSRNALILDIYAQMDRLSQQLIALGVHTHAPSNWKVKS